MGVGLRRELTALQFSWLLMDHAPAGECEEVTGQLRDCWETGGIDQRNGLFCAEYRAMLLRVWAKSRTDAILADADEWLGEGFTPEQIAKFARLRDEYRRRQ